MSDTDAAVPKGATRTGVRLAVVAAVAAAGFGGALLVFGGGDDGASGEAPPPATEQAQEPAAAEDADYEVSVDMDPDPPRVEGTAFSVRVTHAGEPVTGADVEIRADMDDHAHDGISATASEVEPGRYETDAQHFPMRGGWRGQVRVTGDDGSASAPLHFTLD